MPHTTSILLLGDGPETSRLRQRLTRHFLAVECARTFDDARELTRRCRFHLLVLVDPEESWQALQQALADSESLPSETLLVASRSSAELAVEALRGGMADALLRPFSTEQLVAAVNAVCGKSAPQSRGRVADPGPTLIGNSPAMHELRALIEQLAPAMTTVLIEGEAGTGRTLAARLLHDRSSARGPFVLVDCSATAPDRLAGEIARHLREGGGTLFLREIQALPFDMQTEMLRSMEMRGFGDEHHPPDAQRLVASTQADLGELVSRGRFREDLYHRLRVTRIGLPPLRARRADIRLLAAHFVDRLSAESGLAPVEFQAAEFEALEQHDWPGNVRQLRETVEQTLLRGQLPADALAGSRQHHPVTPVYPLDWTLEQVKRHHMACVLETCDGNKSAAARRLEISRKTLDRKLGASGRE